MNAKNIFLVFILIILLSVAIYGSLTSIYRGETSIDLNGHQIKVEIADTPAKQARGLSGRESLAENFGMLFIFFEPKVQRFWMKDMKFPIDIIWISQTADGDRVVGFVENAPVPVSENNLEIFSSPENVDKVLEINAGLVKKWGIKVGDKILH